MDGKRYLCSVNGKNNNAAEMKSANKCGTLHLLITYNGVLEEILEEIRYTVNVWWDLRKKVQGLGKFANFLSKMCKFNIFFFLEKLKIWLNLRFKIQ